MEEQLKEPSKGGSHTSTTLSSLQGSAWPACSRPSLASTISPMVTASCKGCLMQFLESLSGFLLWSVLLAALPIRLFERGWDWKELDCWECSCLSPAPL